MISGYPDGGFKPDETISRAELVTLAAKYAKLPASGGNAGFPDIHSGHWAKGFISAAYQAGWIKGYPNGSFGPERSITRAETVIVLNAMLGRTSDEAILSGLTMPFTDVAKKHWAYNQILEAAVKHEHK